MTKLTRTAQCSSYQAYGIIQGIFAISSDLLMLAIAIPLFMTLRLPRKQKMILLFVFGMGIFIVIAAILTKMYCLVPWLISYVYMNWYMREATVSILVTCLPMTWSLLRDLFPMLARWVASTATPISSGGTSGGGPLSQSASSSPSWWSPFRQQSKGDAPDAGIDLERWESGLPRLPSVDKP